jgi:type I restriction enzyme, S subunit
MINKINIPEGWKEVKLKEVCKIKHGKSQKDVKCHNGKYPILASGGLIGLANNFLYDKESVLIGRKGTIDKPQYMNTPFWTVDTLFYTEIKNQNNGKWLFYNFSFIKWKKYNEGSTVPSLTSSGISNIKILLPSPPEQKDIASILEKWDEAIEKTSKLIAAKKNKFEWLRYKLIVNLQHNNEVILSNIFQPISDKNTENNQNVLTSSAKRGLISQLDYYHKSVSAKDLTGYLLIKKGDFAYNRSSAKGYPYGAIKRLNKYEKGILSTLYLCFRLVSSEVSSDFAANLFESSLLNKQLRCICQEGARSHGLLNITKNDFFSLKISLPTLLQQKQIAKTLNTTKKEITILEGILAKYKSQKKGLMQKLLTGKIRVNNINSIN